MRYLNVWTSWGQIIKVANEMGKTVILAHCDNFAPVYNKAATELLLPGAKMTWNSHSQEGKYHGSFAPWSKNVMKLSLSIPKNVTLALYIKKPSCRWQTRTTLAKSLHGLRKSSGVVSCIARLPIDSVPMVSYYVLYSNCVCKMRRFGDTRLLKLPWPW